MAEKIINRPNLLLIVADDMNWDALGAFGCPTHNTTPNIDRLAGEGIRFNHAHITIAVCQPSRSAMMTGLYPHQSGGEGFHHLRHPGIPILPELLRGSGYTVGILGKVVHSTPYSTFDWNMMYDREELGEGRNPEVYYRRARSFMQSAKDEERPFFLMANSHDPHRPFYGNDPPEWYESENRYLPSAVPPSRTFTPDEIKVPDFLPDLPQVRLEISEYYNSVRRCDDTAGRILEALRETGQEDDTLVLFLSDNGMAFPFAKTNCYLNSTRTPWIMRWPGVIDGGTINDEHFVSGIDIMPTFLEAASIEVPENVAGKSFLSILRGASSEDRKHVFTQFNQTAAKRNYPMRCVQSKRFGYIYNPWSDGEKIFKNESQSGRTFSDMERAAESDKEIAARVRLFLYRVPEEFYDFENDPDGLENLIDHPDYREEVTRHRTLLLDWMKETGDPALKAFRDRASEESRRQFFAEMNRTLGGE
ncbi:MAG: sulfatase [Spirochaetia bacterium]